MLPSTAVWASRKWARSVLRHRPARIGGRRPPWPATRAGGRLHGHPGDDAVHRSAAGRHPGRARRDGHRGRTSANWFVKDLPLFVAFIVLAAYTYSSGLRAPRRDRLRQGHADLPRHHRGRAVPALAGRWLGSRPRRRQRLISTTFNADNADAVAAGEVPGKGLMPPPSSPIGRTPRWPSGRLSRCSCTRTR